MSQSDPAKTAEETANYEVARIREALAIDERANELNIDISVESENVILRGHVATPERREAVTAVVREILPRHKIHNETEVGSFPPAAEPEEL